MSGPQVYKVSEAVGPLGFVPVVKQPLDVREIIIDFSRWLDTGETLGALANFAILANPGGGYPIWQTDFPFVAATGAVPADTNPLYVMGASIVNGSLKARLLLAGGTPGLSYMVSFLATVAPTQRVKQIDTLVFIDQPVNSAMISSVTPPTQSVTVVGSTTALAVGTAGSVFVENGTNAPITITLPASPLVGQTIDAVDVSGNAGVHAATWQGAAGALVNGAATFVFDQNSQAATFQWTGTQWSVL